jgi:CRP/FNR family transcriptional regulator
LQILETHQISRGESADEVYLPMSRSDFGHYVGMSLEAVSRSFRTLTSRGVIAVRDRRHVKIVNRDGLESIALEVETPAPPSTTV